MPAITVGVPVYNGDAMLGRALENLRSQTFGDFQVIVYDNCSSDRSPQVAAEFAQADARFVLYQQTSNRGAQRNFADVLSVADTEYFAWRGHDDLSDPNYLEVLYAALERWPDADLAIGQVQRVSPDGGSRPRACFPECPDKGGWQRKDALLRGAQPAWIYGLFRTERLRCFYTRAQAEYPQVWGQDHIALFSFIFDERVAYCPGTCFYQYSSPGSLRLYAPRSWLERVGMFWRFYRCSLRHLNRPETLLPDTNVFKKHGLVLANAWRRSFPRQDSMRTKVKRLLRLLLRQGAGG